MNRCGYLCYAGLSLALLLWTCGCGAIGSSEIQNGRSTYRDAIQQTDAQQALRLIVGLRYGEPVTILSVSSVTANIKFTSNVGAQFGIGSSDNFAGRLVPLDSSVAYEESPTISYAPVASSRYMYQLLSPISLELYLLMVDSDYGDLAFQLLTDRVNGLKNQSACEPDNKTNIGFERLSKLLVSLVLADCLDWGKPTGDKDNCVIIMHDYAPDHLAEATEFLHLCHTEPAPNGGTVIVPITFGIHTSNHKGFAIETRTLYQALHTGAAGIDVPSQHVENGLALPLRRSTACSLPAIHSSLTRPPTAALAIFYRGYWFYIDAADHQSRVAFQLLQTLLDIDTASVTDQQQRVPILTVPVGR